MAAKSRDRKPMAADAPKRRGKGFRQAGKPMQDTVKLVAGRHGFAETDVLLRWEEIVGPALAASCRPVKVHYGAERALGATLIVQADSGRAPEVTHQAQIFVDRVNQFYGYRAIRRLKVTQSTGLGSGPGFAEARAPFAHLPAALEPTAAENEAAAEMARQVETPDLRAALARMGAHVLARTRAGKS